MRVRLLLRVAAAAGTVCLAAGAGGLGCEAPTSPAPAHALRVDPLPSYAEWWQEDEACSGLRGDFQNLDWYVVPADSDGGFWCADGPDNTCAGEWVGPHAIYLAGPNRMYPQGYAADEWTVRHEMLHDLVGRPGHPSVFDDCRLASRTPSGVFGLGKH